MSRPEARSENINGKNFLLGQVLLMRKLTISTLETLKAAFEVMESPDRVGDSTAHDSHTKFDPGLLPSAAEHKHLSGSLLSENAGRDLGSIKIYPPLSEDTYSSGDAMQHPNRYTACSYKGRIELTDRNCERRVYASLCSALV
jgi:hypothetical protein